ncbi:GIY-YIG nuclease family protein [Leptolyngbya sp. GGD]|uniref:GIY-YIG nuclease family protein n=1 Tax=Leptolyngbya sp. GGD TaxID=2997907 RepID=UPI00227D20ED|nr:GIY-YIG nuclease family protein [Leptolyngbya sp. GGD]MCU0552744.1 GIY-YIG nuclease family protein [Leptolyngbya sp. Prado105]MCY6492110.1 GIY-YIG nuclease family protein [Leptolyngbya sp. GGD]
MVYLLHFHDRISPNHTTQHYVGFTDSLSDRISDHLAGTSGVALIRAAKQRGIKFTVVRVWRGNRKLERHLKKLKNAPKFCPCCNQKPWELYPDGKLKPAREVTGNRLKEYLLFA